MHDFGHLDDFISVKIFLKSFIRRLFQFGILIIWREYGKILYEVSDRNYYKEMI